MKAKAAELAARGVFVGTSSWKYAGWRGLLYDESRYLWRGKVAESRFERNCLSEYADVFKTVSVDAAYYAFPSAKYLEGLASQVPADFQFGFKVTDTITVRRFPNIPRFGNRAGRVNEGFLDAELFKHAFLEPCESIRSNVGVLVFEFSRFGPGDYEHGRDFVAALDTFLEKLLRGWPYAVEIRNQRWLTPEYFACLARHNVAHVFNSWEAMPSVCDQMTLSGSRPNPKLIVARFLLKPGRRFQDAVNAFKPYDKTKEVNEEARQAAAVLIEAGKATGKKTLIFVNNRLEGNALNTIADIALGSVC